MNIESMIRAVQKEVGVSIDGRAGPRTWDAIYQRICGGKTNCDPVVAPPDSGDRVDERSEKAIATLQPEVRRFARALVQKAASMGITIKVISGLRTYAEQNALYAKGRTAAGSRVTNARGGYSNHNFGIAFDIGVFQGGRYLPESPVYKAVGALGTEIGLEWGGNWKTFQDEPHFQLRPPWAGDCSERVLLAQLRDRTSSGSSIYA